MIVALAASAILTFPVARLATGTPDAVRVTAIALGYAHTCALTTASGVKCWGWGSFGQLGNGSTADRSLPVDVSGLTRGVTAISTGLLDHSCALTNTGPVKCWGLNEAGELGNGERATGPTFGRSIPVDVTGLAGGVSAIAAGSYHTCALTGAGGVKCWGYQGLGDPSPGSAVDLTPADVPGLESGVTAIAAGWSRTCALTMTGGVRCWGDGNMTPIDVPGLAGGITAIAVGAAHACAITAGGGVKCWGINMTGQLGDGTTTDSPIPVDVLGLRSGVVAVTAGIAQACALTSRGGVQCWGSNDGGQLGNGSRNDSRIPVDVSGLGNGVAAIATGYRDTCAITTAGGLKCWGINSNGEVRDGTLTPTDVPVDVDFASHELPPTDIAQPGSPVGRWDVPLPALLAGLATGIAMLLRRRASANDRRGSLTSSGRTSRPG